MVNMYVWTLELRAGIHVPRMTAKKTAPPVDDEDALFPAWAL